MLFNRNGSLAEPDNVRDGDAGVVGVKFILKKKNNCHLCALFSASFIRMDRATFQFEVKFLWWFRSMSVNSKRKRPFKHIHKQRALVVLNGIAISFLDFFFFSEDLIRKYCVRRLNTRLSSAFLFLFFINEMETNKLCLAIAVVGLASRMQQANSSSLGRCAHTATHNVLNVISARRQQKRSASFILDVRVDSRRCDSDDDVKDFDNVHNNDNDATDDFPDSVDLIHNIHILIWLVRGWFSACHLFNL